MDLKFFFSSYRIFTGRDGKTFELLYENIVNTYNFVIFYKEKFKIWLEVITGY